MVGWVSGRGKGSGKGKRRYITFLEHCSAHANKVYEDIFSIQGGNREKFSGRDDSERGGHADLDGKGNTYLLNCLIVRFGSMVYGLWSMQHVFNPFS